MGIESDAQISLSVERERAITAFGGVRLEDRISPGLNPTDPILTAMNALVRSSTRLRATAPPSISLPIRRGYASQGGAHYNEPTGHLFGEKVRLPVILIHMGMWNYYLTHSRCNSSSSRFLPISLLRSDKNE
jgi:hypothetical protein